MPSFVGRERTFKRPSREIALGSGTAGGGSGAGRGRGGGEDRGGRDRTGREPGERGAPSGETYYFFDFAWIQNPQGEAEKLAQGTTFAPGDVLRPVAVTNAFAKIWGQVNPPVSWTTETVPINTISNISGQDYENVTNFSLVRVDDTVRAKDLQGFIDSARALLLENASGKQTSGGVTYSERALIEVMFQNVGTSSRKPAYAPDGKLSNAPFLFVSDVGQPDDGGGGGGNGGGDSGGGDSGSNDRGDPIPVSPAFRPDVQAARAAGGTLVNEQGAPNSTLVQWATVVGGAIALLSYLRS